MPSWPGIATNDSPERTVCVTVKELRAFGSVNPERVQKHPAHLLPLHSAAAHEL